MSLHDLAVGHVLLIFIWSHSRSTTFLLLKISGSDFFFGWLVWGFSFHELEHCLVKRLPLKRAHRKGSMGVLLPTPESLGKESTRVS